MRNCHWKLLVGIAVAVIVVLTISITLPLLRMYGILGSNSNNMDSEPAIQFDPDEFKHNAKENDKSSLPPKPTVAVVPVVHQPTLYTVMTADENALNLTERLAFELVNQLTVVGKVEFNLQQSKAAHQNLPEIVCSTRLVMRKISNYGGTINNLVGELIQPFKPGRRIVVKGKVHENPTCFAVSLDTDLYHNYKVVAYLSARFKFGNERYVFVRECRPSEIDNIMRHPDRSQTTFPFEEGKFFEMVILAGEDNRSITISITGNATFTYTSLVDLDATTYVRTMGQMNLIGIWQM
ncbi:galectin-8-like isoform X2 [Syngnathus typhle]|uniref:galectin-8-like isoform X2 n=1 Tax=Syngnathus typhle TaxID=161592 RepID=UPI002A6B4C31|nr:galectin-8-like isoform X2 [Syngnathus typhle]